MKIPKNKHEWGSFRIMIQSKYKDENRMKRDVVRAKVNPIVRDRDNHLCCFCGKNVLEVSGSNTIHHIIPERYSGKHKEGNLITICMFCHQRLEKYISIVELEAIKHTVNFLKKSHKV